jgi:8-oxo-dGTP pyrophosphatase MutT (NUDIX family)
MDKVTATVCETGPEAPYDYGQRIKALIADYLGLFPAEEEPTVRLLEQIENGDQQLCNRTNMTGHLTAGGLLFDQKRQAVLLIEHKALGRWLQPGGHLDWREWPLAGAIRELQEELGLEQLVLHSWHSANLLPLDFDSHFIPANAKKAEDEHYHHDFQYLFVPQEGVEIKLQFEEVASYRWVGLKELSVGDFGRRLQRVAGKISALL